MRSGNAGRFEKLFRKALAGFQTRLVRARADDRKAVLAECINDALAKRNFGPNESQIDMFAAGEFRKRRQVGGIDRDQLRQLANTAVSRRSVNLRSLRTSRESVDDGVLTPAGTYDEYSHWGGGRQGKREGRSQKPEAGMGEVQPTGLVSQVRHSGFWLLASGSRLPVIRLR